VLVVAAFGLYRAVRAARAGDELTGVTLAGITGALASPISWHHHLYWFAPALLVLVDAAAGDRRHRVRWVTLASVLWATVTFGLIEVYDYHLLSTRDLHSPPGQLLADWYVLLMLALLVLLPVRRLPRGEPPAAWRMPGERSAPDAADVVTSTRPGRPRAVPYG
jgi:alpha-1,2-mannosyltransferase